MADWLRVEIITGIQKLYALRLRDTPPEDAITGTAEVWIEAILRKRIAWDEQLDKGRVRLAFAALLGSCDRWPAPKMFLDQLGSRAPPPPALPAPTRYQSAKAAENLDRIRALLRGTKILIGDKHVSTR